MSGSANVAIGMQSLVAATGANNVAVGGGALQGQTSAASNTAIGKDSGYTPNNVGANATTTGARQTLLGMQTGQGSATQRNDIVTLGYRALCDGDNAIAIGSGASAGAAGAVALGKDSAGTSATTTTQDEIKLGTALHTITLLGPINVGKFATASAPAYVEGKIYYDTTLHKLRVGGASAYEMITSA